MSGTPIRQQVIQIEPLEIVTRQSTDVQAHADELVGVAVRFIRMNVQYGIQVADVLRETRVSRSTLDRRFHVALGRSAHDEIIRVRLNRVCDLFRSTDLSIAKVAALCGFEHVEYLGVSFRKRFGITPGQYRTHAMESSYDN